MLVLITYDVETKTKTGARRLRRIAKICEDFGQRVQFSVFECEVDPAQWELLKSKLLSEYNPKMDSFRFYLLGSNWQRKIEHYGAKPAIDMHGSLIM
ncbi:MAG: CRISPR-associated endonuclease Cas2 [Chitinivibrionales bacterium]|nr:CRISPR-associated endonuclease Cas2 [Chitinivibrionales bacterium]